MHADANAAHVAAILNSGYMVRHYQRGRWSSFQEQQRAHAIRALGLAVRAAFNSSDDFETLLNAVLDALAPREPRF